MSDGNEKLYDFVARSDASASRNDVPSMTVQADAEDADINTIVRRFGLTGTLPQGVRIPEYADYDEVFDFHTAQNVIAQAQEEFMRIPAEVRARFNNDPGMFLDFAADPDNIDALRDMGLAVPKERAIVEAAPVVDKPV